MWKLAVGFAAFAAISLLVVMQAGDKVDMSGEKHGTVEAHETSTTPGADAPK